MTMKKIRKEDLKTRVEDLLETWQVFAPVWKEGMVEITEIDDPATMSLDGPPPRIPPKRLFFPQSEVLFHYAKDTRGVEIDSDPEVARRRVVLGVKPCDAHALSLLDCVFNGDRYQDPYYLKRREQTVVVALGCDEPALTCFCSSMESGPFSRKGADVFLTDIGAAYVVEVLTPKGHQLFEPSRLEDASPENLEKAKEREEAAQKTISSHVERAGLVDKLDEMAESVLWKYIHEKCIGCGVCTFLCPTCHCFDMVDEGDEAVGQRVRNWDSCQFPLYTLETSGRNPRPSGRERLRQRVMHKFNYFVKSFGQPACVGCGRCIIHCPVNLDVRRVIEAIWTAQ